MNQLLLTALRKYFILIYLNRHPLMKIYKHNNQYKFIIHQLFLSWACVRNQKYIIEVGN